MSFSLPKAYRASRMRSDVYTFTTTQRHKEMFQQCTDRSNLRVCRPFSEIDPIVFTAEDKTTLKTMYVAQQAGTVSQNKN